MTTEHGDYCINESRITNLEAQSKNKRFDLNDLKENFQKQSDSITKLTTEVTRLATILKENQDNRKEHDGKIDNLEDEVTSLKSSLNTFKFFLTIGVALFSGIFCFLVTQLISMIH